MDINVKEKSLLSQRIVYNKITSDNISARSFVITSEFQKSCMLASQRYKEELIRNKMQIQVWAVRER